jgi:hypothetical protein
VEYGLLLLLLLLLIQAWKKVDIPNLQRAGVRCDDAIARCV